MMVFQNFYNNPNKVLMGINIQGIFFGNIQGDEKICKQIVFWMANTAKLTEIRTFFENGGFGGFGLFLYQEAQNRDRNSQKMAKTPSSDFMTKNIL